MDGLEEGAFPIEPISTSYKIKIYTKEGKALQRTIKRLQFPKSDYLYILATLVLAAFIHIRTGKRSHLAPSPGSKKVTVSRELIRIPYEPRMVDVRQLEALQGI